MKILTAIGLFMFVGILAALVVATEAEGRGTTISLWPAQAPGETGGLPAEADTTGPGGELVAGRPVLRLGNVAEPAITIYPAAAGTATGAAVLVCPGGGYGILAMDLEGTEVCAWLNSVGLTAVLLKYRVPRRPGRLPYEAPLQDAQRALGLVRVRARELGIDPNRIGVLGFSAGAHLAALLSTRPGGRTYPPVDTTDATDCRPDFCALIYPAYLTVTERNDALAPEFDAGVASSPPVFLVMTEDDPLRVGTALGYYRALATAGVPVEMHLYPRGGHGYGLRRTAEPVTRWNERFRDWLESSGWLRPVPALGR